MACLGTDIRWLKGFLALQSVKTPGIAGTNRIYIDGSTDLAYYQASTDVWIGKFKIEYHLDHQALTYG